MIKLFDIIINMSLTASFAALAVMLARILLKKAPKLFSYILWSVVLFRLLCPFTFNSPISMLPHNTEVKSKDVIYSQNIELDAIEIPNNISSTTAQTSLLTTVINEDRHITPINREIGSIIWLLGIAVLSVYGIISYFRLKFRISTATRIIDNIYETDRIKTPFVFGLITPRIIVPKYLSSIEFQYIIKHEQTHIKRFDHIIKPIAFLALIIHWFNPIIWLSYFLMTKDMEMSCDESVLRHTREDIRTSYSSSLLSLSVKQSGLLIPLAFGESNVKSRIKNILNYKKTSFWIIIAAIMAVVLLAAGLLTNPTQKASESDNIPNTIKAGTEYKNEVLGFSLELPKEWKEIFIIEESKDSVCFYSKKVYDKYNGLGLLFTIERKVGELITVQDMEQAPVGQKIILKGNGYTYIVSRPSDVQYPIDNEELSKDYISINEKVESIYRSISLLGNQKPKAVNEGFKVVGTSFFTVEIPNNANIEQEVNHPNWNIVETNNFIGSISLIPYNSQITADSGTIVEYIRDDETHRKLCIAISSQYCDKTTMEKMKNSLKFVNGPFNIVDLETASVSYHENGGNRFFGMIEGFEIKNEKTTAVRVKLMKFIQDDESPNGFHIEDTKQIETYYLDSTMVAPLMPPNYNTYGMYYFHTLEDSFDSFYKDYNWKSMYYHFIIGSNGKMKIIFGQYVP